MRSSIFWEKSTPSIFEKPYFLSSMPTSPVPQPASNILLSRFNAYFFKSIPLLLAQHNLNQPCPGCIYFFLSNLDSTLVALLML